MRRLRDGRVAAETFDYDFLRFRSGRYGLAALRELAAQQPAGAAAQRATQVLAARTADQSRGHGPPTAQSRAANITLLHAASQTLPERFLRRTGASIGSPGGSRAASPRRPSARP